MDCIMRHPVADAADVVRLPVFFFDTDDANNVKAALSNTLKYGWQCFLGPHVREVVFFMVYPLSP